MIQDREPAKLPYYLDEDGIPTCPKCGCQDTKVTHSMKWDTGVKVRRRVCNNEHCGWVFPRTIEVFDESR